MSESGGLIGVIFGTGDAVPLNAAIFVIVLCSVMALMVVFLPINVIGDLNEEKILANLRETATMALAYLFGRTGRIGPANPGAPP